MIPISIRPNTISSADISSGASKLNELLHAFAVLAPPERVIHVGTGSRQSASMCWLDWPLTEAIVIDAEEQDFEHIDAGLNPKTKISKHCAVLAETDGAVDYFVANNLSENGLADPTLLRMIWPSLAQSHRSKKDASTIDHLVSEATLQSWLVVDCLPAVRILSGARNTLKDSTLVCVRALAEPGFRGEPVGADIKSIDSWLEGLGFKRLAFVTGLNPKIGHAIYGRSAEKLIEPQDLPLVKALNHDLESVRKELLQALDEKKRVSADLTKERDAIQMRAAELETQLKTVAEQHAMATNQQAKAHTETQVALQAKLTEAQKQVEAQTQAKDKTLLQLAEAQKSLETTKKSLVDTQSALVAVQQSEAEAKKAAETTAASIKLAQAAQQEVQTKLDAITKARDASKIRAAELEAQLKTAAEQHAATTAQQVKAHTEAQAALQAKLTEAQKQVEAQTQAKNQALQQVVAQTQAKDKALKQLAEAQKSVETSQKSLAEAEKASVEAKKSLETTTATLKNKESALQAELSRIQTLTAENQELAHRQQLMNEELIKAEGQISLIKDLLLREQGI